MKADIHPKYHPVVFQDVSTNFAFLTRSTATSKDTIKLRFAESAHAMLVQSKMWDVGLIYCEPR